MNRVLIVKSTPYDEDLAGYNVQGIGIAKAFCRAGYNCDYLNYNRKREEIVTLCRCGEVEARAIYKRRIRILRTGICLDALKKEFLSQYDMIICREYNQIMTHFIAKRHPNTSMYSGPYWNMFVIPFFSSIYDFLFTKRINKELKNKFVKSQLAKEFLEKKGYTDLIDVGVGLDTSRFENVQCTDSTKEIADYMSRNKCILYVGTLDENKNIPFILDVFSKLQNKAPGLKLVLIGRSKQSLKNKLLGKKNESYFEELMKNTPETVRNALIHIERVENPQLQFIYPLAKAFILPSIHEIFGMVMLEAMYFGAPVITSRNGGSSTLIQNEDYGQMIPEYDADKWAEGIIRYLEDEQYTVKVKDNCKRLIREKYTWDYIISTMLKNISISKLEVNQ